MIGKFKRVQRRMTKETLDKEFTRLYSELLRYAEGALRSQRLHHDPTLITSDAYCHCLSMTEDIENLGHLESIAKNYIKMNIQWWNSPYRRLHRGSEVLPTLGTVPSSLPFDLSVERLEEVTREFVATLNAREKRLFHIYVELECRKGREFSDYLGISISGAYLLIHEAIRIENRYRQWCINKLT